MRILIINPNSDPDMTRKIEEAARSYARGDFEIICRSSAGAPVFIDSYADEILTAPGMMDLVRRHEDRVDAFVIACMDDPNLDAVKEMTTRPVVGIAEAAMKIASMIGHRFSIVSTSKTSVPNHEALARRYHLEDILASVRFPPAADGDLDEAEPYFLAARAAVEEDLAEVIVLGCAGLTDLARRLEERLGVPVLDGVVCGVMIAAAMARAGIHTSKAGRYRPRES